MRISTKTSFFSKKKHLNKAYYLQIKEIKTFKNIFNNNNHCYLSII